MVCEWKLREPDVKQARNLPLFFPAFESVVKEIRTKSCLHEPRYAGYPSKVMFFNEIAINPI